MEVATIIEANEKSLKDFSDKTRRNANLERKLRIDAFEKRYIDIHMTKQTTKKQRKRKDS